MRMLVAIVIASAGVGAAACKGGGDVAVVAGAPAGDVTEASGDVHATRDGATRALAKGDAVSGDDVIATGADGRVTIVLRHNQVPWSLGPSRSKRVADSAAWSAAKGAGPETVSDDHSEAAGRHAERSATESGASLSAPAPQAQPAPPAAAAPGAAAPEAQAAAAPAPEAQPAPPPAPVAAAAPAAPAADEAPPVPPPASRAASAKKAPPPDAVDALRAGDGAIGGGAGGGMHAPIDTGAMRPQSQTQTSGRLTVGEVSSTGGVPSDAATRVIRARTGLLRACYQRALQSNPSLAGMVTVRLAVGPDGAVTDVQADASADLGDAPACIRGQLHRLVFPSESAPSTIAAKIVLAPSS